VRKGVFIDGHERPDVVDYRQQFVAEMHRLSPYLVEFESDGKIKDKSYPANCEVGGSEDRPIIVITHDESIFSANDGKRKAWGAENQTFLRPKGKGKGIMVSDFLLPWSRLNLFSLPKARQEELQGLGIPLEATVLYEYGKEEGYWDGKMLLEQSIGRALPIAEALYPGYKFLFLFDNATSHSVYSPDALRASKARADNNHFCEMVVLRGRNLETANNVVYERRPSIRTTNTHPKRSRTCPKGTRALACA